MVPRRGLTPNRRFGGPSATARASAVEQARNVQVLREDPQRMVPRRGLEPPRGCPHWHLKPARLPIPPPRHEVSAAAVGGAVLAPPQRVAQCTAGPSACQSSARAAVTAGCGHPSPNQGTTFAQTFGGSASHSQPPPARLGLTQRSLRRPRRPYQCGRLSGGDGYRADDADRTAESAAR